MLTRLQAFNEAGIAFEPFHLKKEREEGYFDADGNYIQFKLDEVKDAWLDSLAEGDLPSRILGQPVAFQQDTVIADAARHRTFIMYLKILH